VDSHNIDFDDLPDDEREKYLIEAFEALYQDNQIPYGIATGDDGVYSDYEPVIDLARKIYESQF
jgi:hypothetical protein